MPGLLPNNTALLGAPVSRTEASLHIQEYARVAGLATSWHPRFAQIGTETCTDRRGLPTLAALDRSVHCEALATRYSSPRETIIVISSATAASRNAWPEAGQNGNESYFRGLGRRAKCRAA